MVQKDAQMQVLNGEQHEPYILLTSLHYYFLHGNLIILK